MVAEEELEVEIEAHVVVVVVLVKLPAVKAASRNRSNRRWMYKKSL